MKSTDILCAENIKLDPDTFIIRWQVTNLCNYACDFCVQGNKQFHIEQAKKESSETRELICRNLITFIENQLNGKVKKIEFYLLGGEVTILKDFLSILERLINVEFQGDMSVCITSNMSMSEELCRKIRAIFNGREGRSLTFSCSYYENYANEDLFFQKINILTEKPFYEKILNKPFIRRLLKRRHNIQCNVGYPLADDGDYLRYRQFLDRHSEYKRIIHPIIIRDYKTSISWDVKQKLNSSKKRQEKRIKVTLKNGRVEYFRSSQDISMILDEDPYFQPHNFLCDIGIHNITIDSQGIISRCVSATKETMIGNICMAPPVLLTEKIRCPANRCGCSYYSRIDNDLG